MTLLELLVKELPKRGGWPEGAVRCGYFNSTDTLYFTNSEDLCPPEWRIYYLTEIENSDEKATREQYEAALSASQRPVWDGEGLPPVGCECEARKHSRDGGDSWVRVKIMYMSEFTAVMQELEVGSIGERIHHPRTLKFRPIRTESERKREEAIEAIKNILLIRKEVAQDFYGAIAAGKITGVKIDNHPVEEEASKTIECIQSLIIHGNDLTADKVYDIIQSGAIHGVYTHNSANRGQQ